ncbi:MAG TPA: COR domain-containing protein [Pyrinomonadaceae bacterium]
MLLLNRNPLNPELAAAYKEGLDAVMRYLRAKAGAQVVLNEAKLILIGEGEVGKSCLLDALRGDPWEERPSTHGIEIKPVKVVDPESGKEITLNAWDFGGQRVYRPTHQLFFSAPAVYLVVWKPREGPQQGFVKEWIKLVKHREPEAKILVVATHGGPKERQPDIDRQEIWDLFGREMVSDFFLVESKPDEDTGERKGIDELKQEIARVAVSLPEVGRTVPKSWDDARKALKETAAAYMPLEEVLELCQSFKMDEEMAKDFVRVSHRLGHLIHYEHDPALRDIVILKPDWLATAISLVLDDKQTRHAHGLVEFSRLRQLWNDPSRPEEYRYEDGLHPLFLRLMERFDLSYKVAIPSEPEDAIGFWQRAGSILSTGRNVTEELSKLHYTSLIAQLVPDIRPDTIPGWSDYVAAGDEEQSQICRIVEANSGQTAPAEGLFFRLIVRLHKYSLGRLNYAESTHWQRGLVLEDDYGARALLEHVGNDVRITVRSPYPERFLSALTYEVKWLVETFWAGLRCDVMVPCLNTEPCKGLFEVRRLIENKKRSRPEQPCPVCNEWQSIELLLHNAPAARPNPLSELLANSEEVMRVLGEMRLQSVGQHAESMGRFDRLDAGMKEVVSKVEASYSNLMRSLVDEAKEGPRLFSFEPVEPGFFDRPKWISEKFRLTLWCEHSRLPLPALNGDEDARGVYELTLPRDWIVKAAPFLKLLASTLSLVVPVAASATKLMLDEASYKGIEKQLDLGQKSLDSVLKGGAEIGGWLERDDAPDLEQVDAIRARGAVLRQLHAWLKEKDPGFGGLVRVQNKRQEFLWVHPQFEKEY